MSKLFKVVVTDFLTHPPETEERILAGLARVEVLRAHHEDDLLGRIEDADAVMIYHCLRFTEKSIARLDRCKLIVRCGVGYDNVDWAYARARGIPVANVPDYGTEEVADSAIGLTLALTRGIALLNSRLRAGEEVVPGDGRNFVSPVHVADMAAACAAAIARAPGGAICNVVDEPLRQGDYLDGLAALVGAPLPPRNPSRPSPPSLRCSNARARDLLGWSPARGIWPAAGQPADT